jgi:hypothetical protein
MEKLLLSFSVCIVTSTSSVGSFWVRTPATSYCMCGGQRKSGTGFLRGFRLSSVIIIPPVANADPKVISSGKVSSAFQLNLDPPPREVKIQLFNIVQSNKSDNK